ncbi:rCG36940 [Rattus norvegicus]|uniref:RCG36940 n=1 Tax=Rattus norvegicus TaxID=10116 RepID=A6HTX8_RAT|nr:rCG36940 [Rattus norvegicus]
MYSLYRIRSLAPFLFTAVAWSVMALLMVDLYT